MVLPSGTAILARSGPLVFVRRSVIHSNVLGIQASEAAVGVAETVIRDNAVAMRVFDTFLSLDEAEIAGQSIFGVVADGASTVSVRSTTFRENGQLHLGVLDRGSVEISDSAMGAPGDPTGLALSAAGDSRLELIYTSADEIYGGASLIGDSDMSLTGTTLHGEVDLQDFSWMKLTRASAPSGIACSFGSKAACGADASAPSSDCGDVATTCGATPLAERKARRVPVDIRALARSTHPRPGRVEALANRSPE